MRKILCFFHPEYKGTGTPHFNCKTCCKMYLNKIKKNSNEVKKLKKLLLK